MQVKPRTYLHYNILYHAIFNIELVQPKEWDEYYVYTVR